MHLRCLRGARGDTAPPGLAGTGLAWPGWDGGGRAEEGLGSHVWELCVPSGELIFPLHPEEDICHWSFHP